MERVAAKVPAFPAGHIACSFYLSGEIMLKFFFFHLPKAGGTSLRSALEATTPKEQVAPLIENDAVGHAVRSNYNEFRGYHLYAGHYGRDVFDAVDDGHVAITNFRHPVLRIISLYNFFRDHVDIPAETLREERYFAVRFAKENAFEAFVECDDPRVAVYTRNQHVRQLTKSPWEMAQADFEQAWRFVLTMPCFYLCEYPGLSTAWLGETLGIQSIGYQNRTMESASSVQTENLERHILKRICFHNQEDLQLYRFAAAAFLSSRT